MWSSSLATEPSHTFALIKHAMTYSVMQCWNEEMNTILHQQASTIPSWLSSVSCHLNINISEFWHVCHSYCVKRPSCILIVPCFCSYCLGNVELVFVKAARHISEGLYIIFAPIFLTLRLSTPRLPSGDQ